MKKLMYFSLVVAFVVSSASVLWAAKPEIPKVALRLSCSAEGSEAHACALPMARVISTHSPSITSVDVLPLGMGPGPRLLEKGQVDFCYTAPNMLVRIHNIMPPYNKPPLKKKPLHGFYYSGIETGLMTLAKRDDLRCYDDLIGKKIFAPSAGGGQDLSVLANLGEDRYSKVKMAYMSYREAADGLTAGIIDVISAYTTNFGRTTASWLMDADARVDLKFIVPTDSEWADLKRRLQGKGYYPTTVTETTALKGDHGELRLTLDPVGYAFPSDLAEEYVYEIVKAVVENASEMAPVMLTLKLFAEDPFKITTMAIDASPDIPVHPGAAKYYKERGVWKDNWKVGTAAKASK